MPIKDGAPTGTSERIAATHHLSHQVLKAASTSEVEANPISTDSSEHLVHLLLLIVFAP